MRTNMHRFEIIVPHQLLSVSRLSHQIDCQTQS
jgi:hypothetical protein